MSTTQTTSAVSSSMSSIKLKKKHIRVKHQKVKLFRASEPLLSVLMWGINHTVSVNFVNDEILILILMRYF